jgi:hypothetical protein
MGPGGRQRIDDAASHGPRFASNPDRTVKPFKY